MSAIVSPSRRWLRSMGPADVRRVLSVEQASYDFPWSERTFRDCLRASYTCRIAEGPDGVLGYGIMSIGAGECHVLNLCVHPGYRNHGLGRELLEHLMDIGRRFDATTAFLEVRVSNEVAHRLYSRLGFNEIGTRRGYYPASQGREDAIVLARML